MVVRLEAWMKCSLDTQLNAGYVLAVIVGALTLDQAQAALPDILHITTHYLRPTAIGPFEVHVKLVRSGKTTCNLTAELRQKVHQCQSRLPRSN